LNSACFDHGGEIGCGLRAVIQIAIGELD